MSIVITKTVTCDSCGRVIEPGEWYRTEKPVISSKDKGKTVRKDYCTKCYNEVHKPWT